LVDLVAFLIGHLWFMTMYIVRCALAARSVLHRVAYDVTMHIVHCIWIYDLCITLGSPLPKAFCSPKEPQHLPLLYKPLPQGIRLVP
jgi:hypothetical protein